MFDFGTKSSSNSTYDSTGSAVSLQNVCYGRAVAGAASQELKGAGLFLEAYFAGPRNEAGDGNYVSLRTESEDFQAPSGPVVLQVQFEQDNCGSDCFDDHDFEGIYLQLRQGTPIVAMTSTSVGDDVAPSAPILPTPLVLEAV